MGRQALSHGLCHRKGKLIRRKFLGESFIPSNRYSQLAFNAIVGTMKLDPDWSLHVRQFIHVDEVQRDLPSEWQASDTENEKEDEPRKLSLTEMQLKGVSK